MKDKQARKNDLYSVMPVGEFLYPMNNEGNLHKWAGNCSKWLCVIPAVAIFCKTI